MPLIPDSSGLLEARYNKTTGRTGLARMRTVDGPDGKRRVGFAKVNHPIDSARNMLGRAIPFDREKQEVRIPFEDLRNGYHTDGYIRQSVDKYAEKVVSAGHTIKTDNDEIEKYLNKRMFLMGQATGYPFPLLISDTVRRFIRDGNSFLVKAWTKTDNPFGDVPAEGLLGRKPIGGLFVLEATNMVPYVDRDSGIRKAWIHRSINSKGQIVEKLLDLDQVYHFAYCPEGMDGWGYSQNLPSVEDIRALRTAEESVLSLIYRHLNPLIHIATPDLLNDGLGRQEDIDMTVQLLTQMAHDGFIVTGPGHKIDVIGSESQALRADPYLNFFKKRSFASLGISSLVMGVDAYMGSGGRNAVDVQMHSRARHFQWVLGIYITHTILIDLLNEGGYDILDADGKLVAEWEFLEFDSEEIRKQQNHHADLFTKDIITQDEARDFLNRLPLTEDEKKNTYLSMKTDSQIKIQSVKDLKAKGTPSK